MQLFLELVINKKEFIQIVWGAKITEKINLSVCFSFKNVSSHNELTIC